MTDDPTTTGADEGERPEGWQNFFEQAARLAEAAGADTSEAPEVATGKGLHFGLQDFTGEFQIVASEQTLLCNIVIPPPGGMEKVSATNPPTIHSFLFPRERVGDVDPERLFGIIVANFKKHIWQRFADEAVLFFTDLVNFALLDLNPGLSGAASRDRIIKNHAARTEAGLRQFFGGVKPPRRGQASPWTMLELSTAVKTAAGQVPAPATAAKVAKKMRALYGEKAPTTGKALLKLVGRHGLKWADLLKPSPSPSPEPDGDS